MPLLADLHNHSLYGVDDGAADLATGIAMITASYAEGVRILCLTPHADIRRFPQDAATVTSHFATLATYCREHFPDLSLFRGNEVFCDTENMDALVQGVFSPLGNGRAVLLEFLPKVDLRSLHNGILACLAAGYYPVLAHAERYACLSGHLDAVGQLRRMRVMIQINASPVLKRSLFADRESRLAYALLDAGMVDIVSSDAHGEKKRTPHLLAAHTAVLRRYGHTCAAHLFYENSRRLLMGEERKDN